MKQIFTLSKKDIELSKEEVLRLYNVKKHKLIDNLLIIDTNSDFSNNLAYTNEIYEFLSEAKLKDLEKIMNGLDWNTICRKSYSFDIINSKGLDKRFFASLIWNKLQNPKVDLINPMIKIVLFNTKQKIICGRLIWKNDKSFLFRKAHLRPQLHPSSLHPQLARACINLTGKKKGKFLDPFCGSGGILIEAGLLGFDINGYDIDEIMLKRAKINLKHYGIKNFNLKLKNAKYIDKKYDCIVTDLPYGKASKLTDNLEDLYKDFLSSLYKTNDAAIVLFPDFINYKRLTGKWNVKMVFDYYLHRSLSKKIVLLEKY